MLCPHLPQAELTLHASNGKSSILMSLVLRRLSADRKKSMVAVTICLHALHAGGAHAEGPSHNPQHRRPFTQQISHVLGIWETKDSLSLDRPAHKRQHDDVSNCVGVTSKTTSGIGPIRFNFVSSSSRFLQPGIDNL
jgi:hypothetical protein